MSRLHCSFRHSLFLTLLSTRSMPCGLTVALTGGTASTATRIRRGHGAVASGAARC